MSDAISLRLFSSDGEHEPGTWTVKQIAVAFLDNRRKLLQIGAFSAKSLDKATRYVGSFVAMFGVLATGKLRRPNLLDWVIEHPEWEATFTRQDAVGAVVSMLRWAKDEFAIDIEYQRPRFLGPPVQPRPAITPDEFRAMMIFARRHVTPWGKPGRTSLPFRVMLLFLWLTGARTCEGRGVLWTEIDWTRGVINHVEHKTLQTSGEPRVIPCRRVLRLLRWLQRRRSPGQSTIFNNSLGTPWTCDRFAKEFRRFARLAGVRDEVSAYCLRHGLCSRLIEAGCGERQVADVLGHKSTRYVSWYARSTRTKADHLNRTLDRDRPDAR